MYVARTLRKRVTISRGIVGSTTWPRRRTRLWGRMGCLGKVLVKNATSSSPSLCASSFNGILWCSNQTSTSSRSSSSPCRILSRSPLLSRLPQSRGMFLLLLLGRWRSVISFFFCVRKFVDWLLTCLFAIFSSSFFIFCLNLCFFLSYVFRVPHESPVRVLIVDMFATLLMTFELPSYATGFAHQFAKAPSPPPPHARPFNTLVLNFLDVEAEQGEDNDRDGSPSHCLHLVCLDIWALCFVLIWISIWIWLFYLNVFFANPLFYLYFISCWFFIPSANVYPNLMLNHLEPILQDHS